MFCSVDQREPTVYRTQLKILLSSIPVYGVEIWTMSTLICTVFCKKYKNHVFTYRYLVQQFERTNRLITTYLLQEEHFSFESHKVHGFASTTLRDCLKNSVHFFIQSIVKPTPIMTHVHSFSHASHQLHVITQSFACFTVNCLCSL